MRRAPAFLALLAALVLAAEATAVLDPVRRDFGEVVLPRVRSGPLPTPAAAGDARVEVLVRLAGAPLAAWQARRPAAAAGPRRLNVREPAARRYLAALEARQLEAVRRLEATVPGAVAGRRFAVLLNAIAVEAPLDSLARLREVPGVTRVYPSLRYTLATNRSPGLVGATAFSSATGARGEGVKIAIVDDGVDAGSPFLDPAGFELPPGFPKGQARFTTAKVIVARSFFAPGTPGSSALAFDPDDSFHGTHVAGIAAGNAGVTAPAGDDHPETAGLSGVAPRAWIGSYRVFNLPTPAGSSANTPEVVAAFERAVVDGMDVINFSGGAAETEPANDALVEAVANVAAAGVVPVVSAGNERDDFGAGSVASPATAPASIAVAAVSNTHVFAPTLAVEGFGFVPYASGPGALPEEEWAEEERPLVDVGPLAGDRLLCAPGRDPNAPRSTLPAGSLRGAVALVSRGRCSFESKALRARRAGAEAVVFVDNRAGEANPVPVALPIPAFMVADLDGERLRAHLAGRGGRAPLRVGLGAEEVVTGRGGVVTSFSSAGPTAFAHRLKPDLAAPGGAVLSGTRPAIADSPFAVFDGTSMAAPHVAGAAALLLERHPGWTPAQLKSALVSTASAAFADTARTVEAPVTLAGGGLAAVDRADDPRLFAEPVSLSFADLNVNAGPAARTEAVVLADAGGGSGEWEVEVRPQRSPDGAWLEAPATARVPGAIAITARAAAGAGAGEGLGFVVLRRGGLERRLPYAFLVTRPGLEFAPGQALVGRQAGDTRTGPSRASVYGYPGAPLGPAPVHGKPPLDQTGAEDVYTLTLATPATNFGVAVVAQGAGARVTPFVLGSPDENDVQGFAGTPANVNPATFGYGLYNGAAGAMFPAAGRYTVAVDSGRDPFTGRSQAGRYVLRAWVDDREPPLARLETTRAGTGRPLLVARFLDAGAGVDPLTLALAYGNAVVGATAYDPDDGIALFPIPRDARPLDPGPNLVLLFGSDFQESKNVFTFGTDTLPNTTLALGLVTVRAAPAVTWLRPRARACAGRRAELLVAADGPRRIRHVRFSVGGRPLATVRARSGGLFSATWRTAGRAPGTYRLRATAVDAAGRAVSAERAVRVCGY